MTIPTTTRPKLKVCWVAREIFPDPDSSLHGTEPLSLKGVTALRFGALVEDGEPGWVA